MIRVLVACLLVLCASAAQAANHYVRQGATGNGSGSDWTNACAAFSGSCAVGSLTRGDTYYVADGAYSNLEFTTPNSGSTVITIRKATVADHGTSTGWVDTYGDGQASFSDYMAFFTSNWVLDGVTGTDYQAGHGFMIDNRTGTSTTLILLGTPGGSGVTNITLRNFDIYGRGYNQTVVNDRGFYSNSTGGGTYTMAHNFMSGVGVPVLTRQVNGITFEYNYIEGNHSQPESHGEPWSDTGTDNVIFRYNKIRNPEGTAVFFIGNGGAGAPTNSNTSSNWDVYGNVFYYQNYVIGSGHNAGVSAILWCPPDVGFGGDTYCHNWKWYNNTFYDFSHGSSSGRILARTGTGITIPVVQNNIWDSCADGADHTNITPSFNYYRNTSHSAETNEQIGTVTPFVSGSTGDYRLAAATNAGQSLATPYNIDLLGTSRGSDGVWDRGAFEFTSGGGGDTTPPVISGLLPTGTQATTTTSVTLQATTDEAATCRYNATDVAYTSMLNTFTSTGTTSHSNPGFPVTSGTSYTRYVRCIDGSGNANTSSSAISFSVANPTVSTVSCNQTSPTQSPGSIQCSGTVSGTATSYAWSLQTPITWCSFSAAALNTTLTCQYGANPKPCLTILPGSSSLCATSNYPFRYNKPSGFGTN